MEPRRTQQPESLRSLVDLRRGDRAAVRAFGDGAERAPLLAQRLASMGLPIGAELEVLVRRGSGPLLLRTREARIALGRDEARCVQVEPLVAGSPSAGGGAL